MTDSGNLGLTFFDQNQSNVHVTANLNYSIIDAMLWGLIIDRDLTAPPGSESEGDSYIVKSVTAVDLVSSNDEGNFVIAGDLSATFVSGFIFTVSGTVGNNGNYTTTSSSFGAGNTTIQVSESVAGDEGATVAALTYATGTWNNKIDDIAYYRNGAYVFYTPKTGWGPLYVIDETKFITWNGTAWVNFSTLAGAGTSITDTDGDTKIQVEEGADDDIVRIDAQGQEVARFDNGKAEGQNVTGGRWHIKPMSQTDRDLLTGVAGDIIFNSTTSRWNGYDGTVWAEIPFEFI